MKTLQIVVLVLGLTFFAKSQNTIVSGTVYDINKAVVVGTEILIEDDNNKKYKTKTNDSGEYLIELPSGSYTIEFSQSGFKILRVINFKINSETEKTLNVTLEVGRCEDCNGALYGKRWDNYGFLSGIVYNTNGAVIENAQLVFRDLKDKERSIKTSKNGNYKIELENGIYSIEINAVGYKTFKIENYRVMGTEIGMKFDVVLEVKSCDDPTVICSNFVADPIKINKP